MDDELTLKLNSPLTEEQWDVIADVDFDHTDSVTFNTKHGKEVEFVKRKTGRWIHHPEIGWGETWLCSECGEKTTSTVMGKPRYQWCPMCGADMREGAEQDD